MITMLLRYWYVVAIAAAAAWGGLGWFWKANVERDFANFRGEQARLVARQQEQWIEERQRAEQLANEVSIVYNKAVRTTEKHYQGEVDQLERLARVWSERVRNNQSGGCAVPSPSETAGGTDGPSCEERLQGIAESAKAVARDLDICTRQAEQLDSLQRVINGL